MPPEIARMILHELEPRDAVTLSQAFFAAERCYYASEPQFKNIDVGKLEKDVRSKSEVLLNRFNCDSPNLPIYDESYNSWEILSRLRLRSYSIQSFLTTPSLDWLMAWKIAPNSRSSLNSIALNGPAIYFPLHSFLAAEA